MAGHHAWELQVARSIRLTGLTMRAHTHLCHQGLGWTAPTTGQAATQNQIRLTTPT